MAKKLTYDENIIRGLAPIAKNGLDAEAQYYLRKLYKKHTFPEEFGANPIDMWYGRLHYGRVDENYNPIFLSEENLKPIPSESEDIIFVVDFVADAYKDMLNYFEEAKVSGLLCPDSRFFRLNPKTGWVSLKAHYNIWLQTDYDKFARMNSPQGPAAARIKSFDSFINNYFKTLNTSQKPTVTQSKFIFSRYAPPHTNGLIIELEVENHDDDSAKLGYINDISFSFYRDAARRYGFMVDKNAPWRLVADVKSPEMKKYMDVYGVTPENLFSYYYYKSYQLDLDHLRTHLVQTYNSYVAAYPIFRETKVINGHPVTVGTERFPVTDEDIEKKYDLNFWLEKYIMIRNIEEKNKYSKTKLGLIIKKAKNINKYFDIYRALEYTNNNFKFSSQYSKSNKALY